MMGLSLGAVSSLQELVQPPIAKSLPPPFQEVPKHLWGLEELFWQPI